MTNYRLLNKYITEEIDPNAVYVLSLSYGKDSLACLGAIEKLGLPLHRIVHAEVWATDTIPADLPPMMEFKARADEIIERRWGIKVEHICATKKVCGGGQQKLSYEQMFYNVLESGQFAGAIKGFPLTIGSWCKKLKYENGAVDVRRYILSSCAIAGGARIYGFPMLGGQWCNSALKMQAFRQTQSRVLRRNGVNTARGNSNEPYYGLSHFSQPGKLVYPTQTKGFPKARTRRAV